MSSSTYPNTCGLLSTSALFIAVGIIQLLGGIILLKSEHVYLLAGADFIASVSNIILGCLMAVSATSWESKLKRISMKNASRGNVLAGLYISVVAVNATTAIVMIIGDGNSLLIALAETIRITSYKFIGEVLASAYVISVCSPIVCIVVGIVCLSGNRLELREDLGQSGKKQNKSISKSESFGWVFKNRPKLMSESNSLSSLSKTLSGDSVFAENKRLSNSPLTESEKSLKIWAQKRRKILKEITSNKYSLFSDNYLQFPEFSYSSYMESMVPSIKRTSRIHANSTTNSLDHPKHESRKQFCNTKIPTEMCAKNVSPTKMRCATINRSHKIRKNIDTSLLHNFVKESAKISLNNSYGQTLPYTDQSISCGDKEQKIFQICPRNEISSSHTTPEVENHQVRHDSSGIQWHSVCLDDSKNHFSNERVEFEEDVFDYPNDINGGNGRRTRSDTHSVTFDFEPENLMNVPLNPSESSTVSQIKNKLMMSFKTIGEKQHKPVRNSQSTIPRKSYLSEEVFPFPEYRRTITPEFMAGEIIPISVRNVLTSRTNSISISADELGNSKNEEIVKGELQGDKISYSKIPLNDVQLQRHSTNEGKEKFTHELNEELQSMAQIDEKMKIIRNSSSVTESTPIENVYSVDENCSEPFQDSTNELFNDKKSKAQDIIDENVNTGTIAETECKGGIQSRSKRQSAIRYPSIFTGYSMGSDGKTDISNLIMDADSLLGLSDDELLNRTRRLRQLRKSVEIRSKERRSLTFPSIGEE